MSEDELVPLRKAAEEVGVAPQALKLAVFRGRLRTELRDEARGPSHYTRPSWVRDYLESRWGRTKMGRKQTPP